MEILSETAFWVAILSGGAAVKILDYILPFLFGRDERRRAAARSRVTDNADERSALRKDIDYLRREIEELRKDIDRLEERVKAKTREVSIWQQRYWEKRIQLDRVVLVVKHHGDGVIWTKVEDIIAESEEEAVEDDLEVE